MNEMYALIEQLKQFLEAKDAKGANLTIEAMQYAMAPITISLAFGWDEEG